MTRQPRSEELRVVTRDGLGLRAVRFAGQAGAPLLLLVHGFTGAVEAWGDVPAALAGRLPSPWGLAAVDLPGHGASDAPAEPGRYRMEAVARDLEEVAEALGARRAVLVGYSMGGRAALGAACLRPRLWAGLVLESASPGLATEEERRERRDRDEALARRILEEGMEAFVEHWTSLPLFSTRRKLPGEVLARERERRLRGSPAGLAASLRSLGTGAQPSFWDRLGGLEPPVLLLAGEEDAKFVAIARAMEARLPVSRGRLQVVPDAGHTVHLEAPDAWVDAVTDFVGDVPAAP